VFGRTKYFFGEVVLTYERESEEKYMGIKCNEKEARGYSGTLS